MLKFILTEADAELNLERIQISEAKTLFNLGATIYLLPNKIKMNNQYVKPLPVNKETLANKTFDKLMEVYKYFVFNNNELIGNTIWYYRAV